MSRRKALTLKSKKNLNSTHPWSTFHLKQLTSTVSTLGIFLLLFLVVHHDVTRTYTYCSSFCRPAYYVDRAACWYDTSKEDAMSKWIYTKSQNSWSLGLFVLDPLIFTLFDLKHIANMAKHSNSLWNTRSQWLDDILPEPQGWARKFLKSICSFVLFVYSKFHEDANLVIYLLTQMESWPIGDGTSALSRSKIVISLITLMPLQSSCQQEHSGMFLILFVSSSL